MQLDQRRWEQACGYCRFKGDLDRPKVEAWKNHFVEIELEPSTNSNKTAADCSFSTTTSW